MFKVAHKDKTPPQITKHLLGKKEKTCTGDKTLAQIENNSTDTKTFTNHQTFPQIRNTPTNHKTLACQQLIEQ